MKFFVDGKGALYRVKLRKGDTNIIIPEGVTSIVDDVFSAYKSKKPSRVEAITKVTFPSTIKSIGDNSFEGCIGLKQIEIPCSVNRIGKRAFEDCINLEEVQLFEGLISIDNQAFDGCEKLKSINLPKSLVSIGMFAFSKCDGLKEVFVPDSVKFMDMGAFYKCLNLENVRLSNSINSLSARIFSDCNKLKSIEIPEGVTSINEYSFSNCKSLEEVKFPSSLKTIKRQAFTNCRNLFSIELPKNLEHIENSVFYNCSKLKQVRFSSNISMIDRSLFDGCESLKDIKLPDSITYLGSCAFYKCFNLDKITIPIGMRCIEEDAFSYCDNLKGIYLKNIFNLNEKGIRKIQDVKYYYSYDKKDILCLKERENPEEGYKEVAKYVNCTTSEYGNFHISIILSLIFDEAQFKKISYVQDNLAKAISDKEMNVNNYKEILKDLKCDTEYARLCKRICSNLSFNTFRSETRMMMYDLFTLAYSLGAFCEEQVKRQRACEYIYNMFEKEKFTCRTFHSVFESMRLKPFDQGWADFFMSKTNFKDILDLDIENNGFISRIHNNFSDIREFGISNRGSQRYRKVTVNMCSEYLTKKDFEGVNETNEDISREIGKYIHEQAHFNDASNIRNEYLSMRENNLINDHILGEELKEILDDISKTMDNLNIVANNLFSYEFLSKYDPKNFVLGKYCSCCAHLEGAGYGIMKASILHPDCQNLIIRDEKGRIVAKSTLYVNRKQGYGLFNNVEINNKYLKNGEVINKIYDKYIDAIDAFATRYNQLNPSNPLKKINVGMKFNDVYDKLRTSARQSNVILHGVDFSDYGGNYVGDWREEQYTVWSKKDKVSKK